MEHFRVKLKTDTLITAILALVLLTVGLLAIANEAGYINWFTPITGDSHWHARWNGFITGASVGLCVFMIIGLVRNIRALRNESALKKLYVKLNDERTAEIIKSAQAAAYRTFLYVGLVAVIVAGYFSITVSLTILVCLSTVNFIAILILYNNVSIRNWVTGSFINYSGLK